MWHHITYAPVDANYYHANIAMDKGGNILVSVPIFGVDSASIRMFGPSGGKLWRTTLLGGIGLDFESRKLALDAGGNLYVGGIRYDRLGLGPDVFFLAKYERTVPVSISPQLSDQFSLEIYPNPASKFIHLDLELGTAQDIQIGLFDLQGKALNPRIDKWLSPGKHLLQLPLESLSTGVYILRLENEEGVFSKKIVIE